MMATGSNRCHPRELGKNVTLLPGQSIRAEPYLRIADWHC